MLRETNWYTAERSARGVRITAKGPKAKGWPKTGVVSNKVWQQLECMSDPEFNGSVALEIGITSN